MGLKPRRKSFAYSGHLFVEGDMYTVFYHRSTELDEAASKAGLTIEPLRLWWEHGYPLLDIVVKPQHVAERAIT